MLADEPSQAEPTQLIIGSKILWVKPRWAQLVYYEVGLRSVFRLDELELDWANQFFKKTELLPNNSIFYIYINQSCWILESPTTLQKKERVVEVPKPNFFQLNLELVLEPSRAEPNSHALPLGSAQLWAWAELCS